VRGEKEEFAPYYDRLGRKGGGNASSFSKRGRKGGGHEGKKGAGLEKGRFVKDCRGKEGRNVLRPWKREGGKVTGKEGEIQSGAPGGKGRGSPAFLEREGGGIGWEGKRGKFQPKEGGKKSIGPEEGRGGRGPSGRKKKGKTFSFPGRICLPGEKRKEGVWGKRKGGRSSRNSAY